MVVAQPGSQSPEPVVTVPADPTSYPGLPDTTVTPGGISSLFPEVTPSASPSAKAPRSKRKTSRVITTASSLPLDPRLIGGQVVGLAVLAAAITMVVARLSLRTPQPATPGVQASAASEPAEPAEKPEPDNGEAPDPAK